MIASRTLCNIVVSQRSDEMDYGIWISADGPASLTKRNERSRKKSRTCLFCYSLQSLWLTC